MTWTNYHSHSSYCDGTATVDRLVEQAVSEGLHAFGISSHGPLPLPVSWAMQENRLPDYIADFVKLRNKWQNEIELYLGLEVDFVPGHSWWDQIGPLYRDLDYVIGSVHLVDTFDDGRPWEIDGTREEFEMGLQQIFRGDVRAAVSRYFELTRWMLMLENPDILGHLDKIKVQNAQGGYFSETDSWYRQEIDKTLRVAANMGVMVEVNTRGLYTGQSLDLYPSQWILERILDLGIPIVLNSDAHDPKEITAGFRFAGKILRKIGFQKLNVLSEGRWQEVRFSKNGLELPWQHGQKNRTA